MADEKKLPNIVAKKQFLLKGEPVVVGEVVAKSKFPSEGTWRTLCNMSPAKAEETDASVGKPKKAQKSNKAEGEGAKAGAGLPSA